MGIGWRTQKAVIGVALALALACGPAPGARTSDDRAALTTLLACDENTEGCFPEHLLAPPVVSANGQIRAIVAGKAPEGAFRIVALEATGIRWLGEGACPDGSRIEAFGQDASGESLVLCVLSPGKHGPTAHAGRLDPRSGRILWQWHGSLGSGVFGQFAGVHYFALLGSELAMIFEAAHGKGQHPPRWNLVVPGRGMAEPICSYCAIASLLVVDGDLHILTYSGTSYEEVRVTRGQGLLRRSPPLLTALAPTDPRTPCVSQTANGSISVLLPVYGDDPTQPATLLLNYPNAWLPHGPDVQSSEVAVCPPERFPDATRPELPAPIRRWVRATHASDWLLVYALPAIDEHSWLQTHFKDAKVRYQYPGSVRIVQFSDSGPKAQPTNSRR